MASLGKSRGMTVDNVIRICLGIPLSDTPLGLKEFLGVERGQKKTRQELEQALSNREGIVEAKLNQRSCWARVQARLQQMHAEFTRALSSQHDGGGKDSGSTPGAAHASGGGQKGVKAAPTDAPSPDSHRQEQQGDQTRGSRKATYIKVGVGAGVTALLGAVLWGVRHPDDQAVPKQPADDARAKEVRKVPDEIAKQPQPVSKEVLEKLRQDLTVRVPPVPDAPAASAATAPVGGNGNDKREAPVTAKPEEATIQLHPAAAPEPVKVAVPNNSQMPTPIQTVPLTPGATTERTAPMPVESSPLSSPVTIIPPGTSGKGKDVAPLAQGAPSAPAARTDKVIGESSVPSLVKKQKHVPDEQTAEEIRKGIDPKKGPRELLSDATFEKDEAKAWVLLNTALDLAIAGRELVTAMIILNYLLQYANGRKSRANERVTVVKTIISRAPASERPALIALVPSVLGNALSNNDYQAVLELGRQYASQLSKNPNARDEVRKLVERAKMLKKSYDSLAEARAKLQEQPEDPEANQAMGEFYCFEKDEWETALPYLVKSGEPKLRFLAERMIRGSLQYADLHAIALDWSEYGSQHPATREGAFKAAYTYTQRAYVRANDSELAEARKLLQNQGILGRKTISYFGVLSGDSNQTRGFEECIQFPDKKSLRSVEGNWFRESAKQGASIVGESPEKDGDARIFFPATPGKRFSFQCKIHRLAGNIHHILLTLPLEGEEGRMQSFTIGFDLGYGQVSGLSGSSPPNQMPLFRNKDERKKSIPVGSSCAVLAHVIPCGSEVFITVRCDNTIFAEWKGLGSAVHNMYKEKGGQVKQGLEIISAAASRVRISDIRLSQPLMEASTK